MKRIQIQVTDEQVRGLRREAHARTMSVSALVREAVREHLRRTVRPNREELIRRARAIQGIFRSGPPDLATEHDRYLDEAFGA